MAGKPTRVAARTASQIFPTPSEDFVTAEIDFENGARGRITCLSTPPFYARFTLICDQGWVEVQEGGNVDKGIPSSFVHCKPDGTRQTRSYDHVNTVRLNFEAWADALEGRAPLSLYDRPAARQHPHSRRAHPLGCRADGKPDL